MFGDSAELALKLLGYFIRMFEDFFKSMLGGGIISSTALQRPACPDRLQKGERCIYVADVLLENMKMYVYHFDI